MKNEITINGQTLPIREYNGVRIVTFKDIDIVHKRPEGTARKRFNDNRSRFIEGEDYYKISPSEFRTAIGKMDARQKNDVILITETGYLILVKSFTDDLAWAVQRELVSRYFKSKKCAVSKCSSSSTLYGMDRDDAIAFTRDIANGIGQYIVQCLRRIESLESKSKELEMENESLKKRVSALESANNSQKESGAAQTANTLLIGSKTQNNVTYIAEHYGMTAIEMNDLLAKLGVQFRDDDNVWKLTYQYSANDYVRYRYFDNPECPKTMYWTRGGLVFLYTFLAERGVYPIC